MSLVTINAETLRIRPRFFISRTNNGLSRETNKRNKPKNSKFIESHFENGSAGKGDGTKVKKSERGGATSSGRGEKKSVKIANAMERLLSDGLTVKGRREAVT